MTYEEAEAYFTGLDDHGEQATYAVSKLAVLTPDVMYSPLARYDYLKEMDGFKGSPDLDDKIKTFIMMIGLVGDAFSKYPDDQSSVDVTINGLTDKNEATGNWSIDAIKARVELNPTEKTLEAVKVLSEMDPKDLRTVLGRIVDTTVITTVHSQEVLDKFKNHIEMPLAQSMGLVCNEVSKFIGDKDSLTFGTLSVRPGEDSGTLVSFEVMRNNPAPNKQAEDNHPSL